MASLAPAAQLPMLYNQLQPLSSSVHGNFKTRPAKSAVFLTKVHAIPLTSDEFISSQRSFPIVFSAGDNPVPLALMGLNEGVNVFLNDEGKPNGDFYMPAYVRRYPFMLARLRPDADELSLCFDPTSEVVGPFEDGNPLFDGDKPSETTNAILKFCEEFETSAQRTNAFMKALIEADLLIDGEVTVQPSDQSKPFVYRGFKMVSEDKIRDLRGDELRKMNQSGMLPLIMAHLFSLPLVRDIFGRQVAQGKMPQTADKPAKAAKAKAKS